MSDLCQLNDKINEGEYNVYPNTYFYPDPNICIDWSEEKVTQNYVKDGLAISLAKYEENITNIGIQYKLAQ